MQSASELQLVRHAVAPHTYGAQLCVVAAEQLPVPEQNLGSVCVEPEHELEPHWTEVDACSQDPAPSQAPVLPHGGLAVHRPFGSLTPDPTFAQTPRLPPRLHAWHVGQLGLEQQTPSVQKPVPHSLPPTQGAPGAFFATQLPGVVALPVQ